MRSMKRILRMAAKTATMVAALAVFSAPGAMTTPKAVAQELCDAACWPPLPEWVCEHVLTIVIVDDEGITIIEVYVCTKLD